MRKSLPNALTLMNLSLGFTAIYLFFRQNFLFGAIFIVVGAILDGFDGRAERYFKAQSVIGENLDSLSDLVSFGVAPAVLMITLSGTFLTYALALFLVVCGAYRLARFNPRIKFFEGVPITVNGFLFPLFLFFNLNIIVYEISAVIIGLLMVSRFRLKKIR